MRMTATSPAARAAWLEKHALPKAKAAQEIGLKSREMAELLGTSWVTLRKWLDEMPGAEASGAFERGGRGMQYEFRSLVTVWFLIARLNAEALDRALVNKQAHEAVGGDALEGADPEWTLAELDKAIGIARKLREEQQARGELVDVGEVREAIEKMMLTMQQAGATAASKQDPTNLWPPEIRESFDTAMRDVLMTMNQAGQRCLRELNGGTA